MGSGQVDLPLVAAASAAARTERGPAPGRGLVFSAPSAAVGAAAFLAYMLLAPSVPGDKDSGELTLVLAFDGTAHPTGYPLYTVLGHAFTRLVHVLGMDLRHAANAWSALGAALAMAFLHALSGRLVPPATRWNARGRFALTLLPVALFALNPVWTVEGTVAEVYSWHVAWVLGTLLYFAALASSLDASAHWPRSHLLRHAAVWGLLCGVGGAHHVSAIYVVAPLTLLLAHRLIRIRRSDAASVVASAIVVVLAAALPLASYALVYRKAADPGLVMWPNLVPGWPGLLAHVTGKQYQFLFGRFNPLPVQRELLAAYVYPYLFPALVVLMAAALRARGADARILRAIALVALVQTLAAFGYGASDPTSYFLSPMALGLCATIPATTALLAFARRRGLVRPTVAAALIGLVLLNASWIRIGVSRREGYERFDAILHSMWETIPFEQGFVLWGDDLAARLVAYQLLDGEKVGVEVINTWCLFYPPERARFRKRHGFDPVEGISMPAVWLRKPPPNAPSLDEILDAISHRINDHTELPVVVFDGEKRSVRLLRKSGSVASAGDDDLQGRVLPTGE